MNILQILILVKSYGKFFGDQIFFFLEIILKITKYTIGNEIKNKRDNIDLTIDSTKNISISS